MSSTIIKKQLSLRTATEISNDVNAIYAVTVRERAIMSQVYTEIFKYWYAASYCYTHIVDNDTDGTRYILSYHLKVVDDLLTVVPHVLTKIDGNNVVGPNIVAVLDGKMDILDIKRIA